MTFLDQIKQLEPASLQEYAITLKLALHVATDLERQLDDLNYTVEINNLK